MLKDFKFTFWEYIPGINGTMWADSAIPNKYHFVEIGGNIDNFFIYYSRYNLSQKKFVSDGKIEDRVPGGINTFHKLIETYEKVRALEQFDNSHCYEMEHQIDEKGNIYFLQLRRLRDFSPAEFKLDREPKSDEIETSFVLGKTSEKGETLSTEFATSALLYDYEIKRGVGAVIGFEIPFCRIRYPDVKAAIFCHPNFRNYVARGFTHMGRENIAAADLVVHYPVKYEENFNKKIHFTADGERCFMKILD